MKGRGCSLFKPDLSTRPRRLSAHGAAIHPRECREYVGTQPNLKSLSHYPKACFQASVTLSIGAHCKQSHAFPLPVLLHQALADDGRVGSPSPLVYVPQQSAHFVTGKRSMEVLAFPSAIMFYSTAFNQTRTGRK